MEVQGWVRVFGFDASGEKIQATGYEPSTDEWPPVPADQAYRQVALAAYERVYSEGESDVTVLDYELPGLFFEITAEGKAEYIRRAGPTPDEDAWTAKGGGEWIVVWAKTKSIADRVAAEQLTCPEVKSVDVEPATFELGTGEVIDGVKAEYIVG
jgi:hypothetical protein